MKRMILKQIMVLAAGVVAVSCISKNDIPSGDGGGDGTEKNTGKLMISEIGVSKDLRESHKATRAGEVDKGSFKVCIVNTVSGYETLSCAYDDVPKPHTLSVGDYTVHIQSHEVRDAEWEEMHYSMSEPKEFSIVKDDVTTLDDLECKVSNILVSVRFSDKMKAVMADDCEVTVKVGSCGPLPYDVNELRWGGFKAESETNSLVWTFKGHLEDEYYDLTKFDLSAKAGEHHTLNFDIEMAPPPEKGDAEFTFVVSADVVTYDVNLNVEVEKEIPVIPFDPGITIESDYAFSPAVHTLKKSGSLNEENKPTVDLGMDIVSENGISTVSVLLSTDNAALKDALAAAGINGAFELSAVEEPLKTLLEGYGFPTGSDVAGKTELSLNISEMLPMLFGLGEKTINQFDVQVTVRDIKSNVLSRTLRLKLTDDSQASAVTIEGLNGFDIDLPLTIPKSQSATTKVAVEVIADEGIDTFEVFITSTNDDFNDIIAVMQFDGGFDIANPESADMEEALGTLGLPYGDAVKGKTKMTFDISDFVPLLFEFVKTKGFEANFGLIVTDSKGNVGEATITLELTIE